MTDPSKAPNDSDVNLQWLPQRPGSLGGELLVQSPVKPGAATSELWLTLFVIVGANAEAILGILPPKWAAVISVILAVAYKAARVLLKMQAAQHEAEQHEAEQAAETLPPEADARHAAIKAGQLLPLLAMLALIPAMILNVGCASMSEATKENWRSTAMYAGQKALSLATHIVLDAAISSADRHSKLNYTQGLSEAFRSRQGELLTANDVRQLVTIWTPEKPHWEALAGQLAATYSAANAKTPEQAKVVLEAIAQGLATAS